MLEKVKNGPAKRILSLVLVLAMIFPMMHIQASAEDGNAGESTTEDVSGGISAQAEEEDAVYLPITFWDARRDGVFFDKLMFGMTGYNVNNSVDYAGGGDLTSGYVENLLGEDGKPKYTEAAILNLASNMETWFANPDGAELNTEILSYGYRWSNETESVLYKALLARRDDIRESTDGISPDWTFGLYTDGGHSSGFETYGTFEHIWCFYDAAAWLLSNLFTDTPDTTYLKYSADTNISLGKDVTVTSLEGSKFTADLTDGIATDTWNSGKNDTCWFAFKNTGDVTTGNVNSAGRGVVVIDLGEYMAVTDIAVHLFAGGDNTDIAQPTNIYVYSSRDGDNKYGPYIGDMYADSTATEAYWTTYEASASPIYARYIKLAFAVPEGKTVLINEIEVNGEALTVDEMKEAEITPTVALAGSFNNWSTEANMYPLSTADTKSSTVFTTMYLEEGEYSFKIVYNDEWYGNNGTIINTTRDSSEYLGWEMSTSDGNCTLKVTESGTYQFAFNIDSETSRKAIFVLPVEDDGILFTQKVDDYDFLKLKKTTDEYKGHTNYYFYRSVDYNDRTGDLNASGNKIYIKTDFGNEESGVIQNSEADYAEYRGNDSGGGWYPLAGLGFSDFYGVVKYDTDDIPNQEVETKERVESMNTAFTTEGNGKFVYHSADDLFFGFIGDDDVLLFINGKLVIDMSGLYDEEEAYISLESKIDNSLNTTYPNLKTVPIEITEENADLTWAEYLGLEEGGEYDFHFFHMERQDWGSTFEMFTNIIVSSVVSEKTAYDSNGTELDYGAYVPTYSDVTYGFSLTNTTDYEVTEMEFSDTKLGVSLSKDAVDLGSYGTTLSDLEWCIYKKGNEAEYQSLKGDTDEEKLTHLKSLLETGIAKDLTFSIRGFKYNVGTETTISNTVYTSVIGYVNGATGTEKTKIPGMAVMQLNTLEGGDRVVIDFGLPVEITANGTYNAADAGELTLQRISLVPPSSFDMTIGTDLLENEGSTSSLKGQYGTIKIEDGKIVYVPNTNTMNMDTGETVYYSAVNNTNGKVYYGRVIVIPAANIYFEDSFLDFEDSSAAYTDETTNLTYGEWTIVTSEMNIYYDNIYGWEKVYAYCWNGSGAMAGWPGELMTKNDQSGLYSIQIPSGMEKIIFNNGVDNESNYQTFDITVEGTNKLYNDAGSWSYYSDEKVIYYKKAETSEWENVYAYYWSEADKKMTAWPGTQMSYDEEKGIYSITVSADVENVIFSNGITGEEQEQTENLTLTGTNMMYDEGTGTWSYYGETKKIYFHNINDWSNVCAYHWGGSVDASEWPGLQMSSVGDDIYYVEVPAGAENILFYGYDKDNNQKQTGDLTIVGANTIYDKWSDYSEAAQAEDRPGADTADVLGSLDADNIYGYDSAYDEYREFSLGTAHKVTVDKTSGKNAVAPTASFTFTGTGFDVISLTDNTSGAITVTIYNAETNAKVKSYVVNNYYGYTYKMVDTNNDGVEDTYEWVAAPDTAGENPIYQVPVIKVENLEYGKYNVVIKAAYMGTMNMTGNDYYSFWMDAVRIYDPAKEQAETINNSVVKDAYIADDESSPDFTTIKKLLVDVETIYAGKTAAGAMFIDGKETIDASEETTTMEALVADYNNQGPNNEAYLKAG